MRLFKISMAILTMFFVTSTAMAVEFSMLSPTTITVAAGAPFTLNIAHDNNNLTSTNGVVGEISGLSAAVVVVDQDGVAVAAQHVGAAGDDADDFAIARGANRGAARGDEIDALFGGANFFAEGRQLLEFNGPMKA